MCRLLLCHWFLYKITILSPLCQCRNVLKNSEKPPKFSKWKVRTTHPFLPTPVSFISETYHRNMIIVSDPEQGRRKCHSLALTAATLANIQTGYLGCKLLVSGGPKWYAGIVIGAIHKFFSTLISQQTEIKERENICACILFIVFFFSCCCTI